MCTLLNPCVRRGWAVGVVVLLAVAVEADRGAEHYPPDRLVDTKHIKLELVFDDLSSKTFEGTGTYTLRAIADGVRRITFDAVDLTIRSVRRDSNRLEGFDYDGRRLTIRFEADLPTDRDTEIAIDYVCTDPAEGLHFVVPDATCPNRPAQVHTLGEAEFNRFWFPCHDFPNQRSTTETIITVPSRYQVLSNGRLIERREEAGATTFHWRQDLPHVVYLVSLVIGEFAVVEDEWRGIPVTYWVEKGQEADARRAFARTGDMLTFYSELLAYDYPYAQYAQVSVRQFEIGGMEHTSATTLFDQVVYDERAAMDHDMDGLIAHELAHQWFGDLITCRSWAHIWLNEGFATFCNDLWYEHWKGPDRYLYDKWLKYRRVAAAEAKDEPDALVWNRYDDPNETFTHKDRMPYGKGSSLLHMLRYELGDETFFSGLGDYVRQFAGRTVETDEFRRVMETVSGRSLERFFQQWAYRPGVPHLDIRYVWNEEAKRVEVAIRQTQSIDAARPAFAVPLTLYFRVGDVESQVKIPIRRRKEVFRRRFEVKPELFCVDPDAGLLKAVTCTKPRAMWMMQLTQGPTVASRCQAAAQLTHADRPDVVKRLSEVARDERRFWGVREQAVSSLGTMQCDRARGALIQLLGPDGPLKDAKVRAAAVEALGQYRHPDVSDTLVRLAGGDPSYAVEARATRAIGAARRIEAIETVIANAEKDSFQDQIRRAAVWALGELDDRKGMETCMRVAAYGYHDRTRPVAIEALGRLAGRGYRPEDIEGMLLQFLGDPERRAQEAAIEALALAGSAGAIDDLGDLAQHGRQRQLRDAARHAIECIVARLEPADAVDALRAELQRLRHRRRLLNERVESLTERLDISLGPGDDTDWDNGK